MCPAEENANFGRLQPINARKSLEKTDTRTNKIPGKLSLGALVPSSVSISFVII